MTSMFNQNALAYSGAQGPDVLQFPIREPSDTDQTRYGSGRTSPNPGENWAEEQELHTLYNKISRFDFSNESCDKGRTASLYKSHLALTDVADREELYERVLADVVRGTSSSASLLAFVIFEPHMKLVPRAVGDFLANRNCTLDDEFEGVHQVIDVLANEHTVNKGAVLAGLVAVGDRRINAVARAARSLLTDDDIRSFSRFQINKLRSSSVEFCLDWLIELNQGHSKTAVSDLGCALMLMVFHDEQGFVEDLSEINYIGSKNIKILQTKTFESYFCEILPILKYLKKCEGFETVIEMVINAWVDHEAKAKELRAAAEAELYA